MLKLTVDQGRVGHLTWDLGYIGIYKALSNLTLVGNTGFINIWTRDLEMLIQVSQ